MRANRRFAAALLLAGPAQAQIHQPYIPANDRVTLEHVGLPRAPGTVQLREVRAQFQAEPRNYVLALAYARVAVEVGRQEDDPRYFGYAESALRSWLEQAQTPPEARLLRAGLLQARKDFAGARQDLDALVAASGPETAQALLARARLSLVQGDPTAAAQDCAALGARVDRLLQGICAAEARSLHGEAAAALAALQQLRPSAANAALPVQVWLLGSAAAIADRLGRRQAALADYAAAQRLLEGAATRDPGLLAAYADCLLEGDDNAVAASLLAPDTRIDSLLLRLALAERRLGEAGDVAQADAAIRHTLLLDERFREARQRGDRLHLREEALYRLSLVRDPAGALQLAQDNWNTQREPIDARIVLRAAAAAHDVGSAQPVLEWMRNTGIEDVHLQALVAQLGQAAP
ncbi:MAG: hypothetical protein JOY51_03770 [Nevskia sp.]|nr:hypothetical protein [Nevskia sp.]